MGTGPGKDRVLLRQPINTQQKDSHGQHGRSVSLVSLTLHFSTVMCFSILYTIMYNIVLNATVLLLCPSVMFMFTRCFRCILSYFSIRALYDIVLHVFISICMLMTFYAFDVYNAPYKLNLN
jgi:hypothetical protein